MSAVVSLQRQDNIGVITVDNPPVNALARGVRRGLHDAFVAAKIDGAIEGVVLQCAGRTFVAARTSPNSVRQHSIRPEHVISTIEDLGKPVVATIHGTALGGGLSWRWAAITASRCPPKVGLPEVTLGVLPGAGGTQRLPRLIGAADALEMIVSGAPIAASIARDRARSTRSSTAICCPPQSFTQAIVAERAPLKKA
jgi:3-hydroxyacyl-CoA dehydrogenase